MKRGQSDDSDVASIKRCNVIGMKQYATIANWFSPGGTQHLLETQLTVHWTVNQTPVILAECREYR